ncbi:MAG: beta-galactosidase [Verrucomicrobiae bacterium]|nr:beta-galactosidase [Verrucomicrobiae bacterium]
MFIQQTGTIGVWLAGLLLIGTVDGGETKINLIEVRSETNMIRDVVLPKDKTQLKIIVKNTGDATCLWILARGVDKRDIEHGACSIKIELNGMVLDEDRSILQGCTYRMPVHPCQWRRDLRKYKADKQAWSFKFDVDFIMNNQCRSRSGEWEVYTTTDYNHWYVFDVKDIIKKGVNEIILTEDIYYGLFKIHNYNGFFVGEACLCSMDEAGGMAEQYKCNQTAIDPDSINMEKALKEKYKMEMPRDRPLTFSIQSGHIARRDKPFFMTYLNSFSELTGRGSVLDIYAYYSLINVTMAGNAGYATRELMNLPIYLKDGWDKRQIEPWEIGGLLANTRLACERGILAMPYVLDNQGGLPYLEDHFPETLAHFRDGKLALGGFNGDVYPDYAQPLYKTFSRQFFTVLGRVFRENPGILGYSAWEEPGWRVKQSKGMLIPQGDGDLTIYRNYLKGKYQSIERLNSEWGAQYKDFSSIIFPEWKEQSGNFVNFQQWRSGEALDWARQVYETLKREDPSRLVMGQKTYGDVGSSSTYWTHANDNWMLTQYTDISREYSAHVSMASLGRACCREFGKVMEADISLGQDAYRIREKAKPWHWRADEKGLNVYPWLMEMVFNGNRAIHWEIYDPHYGSDFRFLHYNGRLKKAKGKLMHGKKLRFEDGGSADVIIPEKTLKVSRFHQWMIRNSSLVLPAKEIRSQVAVLVSTSSRMIGYDPENKLSKTPRVGVTWVDNAGEDFYVLGDLFDHLHLKFDCVEERLIDHIFKYKALIVGYQANVGNPAVANKIKEYVKKGGTVIFYPEAMSMRDVDFAFERESPGFGLSELCCASIENRKIIERKGLKIADSRFTPEFKEGETVMEGRHYGATLKPKNGGVVLLTGEDGSPALVADPSGRCYYFGGYLGLTYFQSHPSHERFARLVEGILTRAGVEKPVEVELKGEADRRMVSPGLMEGKGYWLVGLNNLSGEEQKARLRIKGLPKGKYEVVDISGERPLIVKGEDGNFHLKPNFEEAQPKYVDGVKGTADFAKEGFDVVVPGCYGKVWLIRPADSETWVNATEDALRSYAKFGLSVKIVIGAGCGVEERLLAEKISRILAAKGIKAMLVADQEIKIKTIQGRLVEEGYELEKYQHQVVDDAANLILIGNAEANRIVKHLQTAGHYVYCKVPEMVTAGHPGRGRGIVQIAESVNTMAYDATGFARDAVILAGSDSSGTIKAIKKFVGIMENHD